MEDSITENSYEEEKRKAKELYSKIGRVWCPALQEVIIFNDVGFRHLIRKGPNRRPKSEQKRRFALISLAEAIIKNPNAIFSHEERETTYLIKWQRKKRIPLSKLDFWVFIEKRDGRVITVVVRQAKGKEKHFFSVYGKKQKTAQ